MSLIHIIILLLMSEKQLSLVFSLVLCYSNPFVLPDSFPSMDAFLLSMDATLNLLCTFYKLFTIIVPFILIFVMYFLLSFPF